MKGVEDEMEEAWCGEGGEETGGLGADEGTNGEKALLTISGCRSICPRAANCTVNVSCSAVMSLSTYPSAPARSPSWMSSVSSNVVRITICASGQRSLIALVAAMPSTRGMRISMRMTSVAFQPGAVVQPRRWQPLRRPPSPQSQSPALILAVFADPRGQASGRLRSLPWWDVSCCLALSLFSRSPLHARACVGDHLVYRHWYHGSRSPSSAYSLALFFFLSVGQMFLALSRLSRNRRSYRDAKSSLLGLAVYHLPSKQFKALAQAHQAESTFLFRMGNPAPIIQHEQFKRLIFVAQARQHLARLGVLSHIGEGLLRGAVEGDLHIGREQWELCFKIKCDLYTLHAALELVCQLCNGFREAERGDAGGTQRGNGVTHFLHRLRRDAARLGNLDAGAGRIAFLQFPDRLKLKVQNPQVMTQRIVNLTPHPRALAHNRQFLYLVCILLQLPVRLLQFCI